MALLAGPRSWDVRGAPLGRSWAIAAFAAAWIWVGLRLIALWRWAWVVLVAVPVLLYLPLRPFLGDAGWLTPLLAAVALLSALTVALVLVVESRWRSERATGGPESRRRTAGGDGGEG